MNDLPHMQEALAEAVKAATEGEIPIGAVLVKEEQIIARAHNTRQTSRNPLHHAEILVLEEAAQKLGDWRLNDYTLYVTVEPCPMCLGALLQARVGKLVFGCADPKREKPLSQGYQFPSLKNETHVSGNNHTLEIVGGFLEPECVKLLKDFFKLCRK